MKRRMIAVLNGSISASCSAKASEPSDTPNSTRKMMYLIGQSRSCSHQGTNIRSEEHTSELQSLMRISYAVFCLKKKKISTKQNITNRKTDVELTENHNI